jgi:hypothetical protein
VQPYIQPYIQPYNPFIPQSPQPSPYVPMTTDRTVITLTTEAFLLQQILEEFHKLREDMKRIDRHVDEIASKLRMSKL